MKRITHAKFQLLLKLLSRFHRFASRFSKVIFRTVLRLDSTSLAKYFEWLDHNSQVFELSFAKGLYGPLGQQLIARDDLLRAADRSYHQFDKKGYRDFLAKNLSLEDKASHEAGYGPSHLRIIGSEITDKIGHLSFATALRAILIELGETEVAEYWLLNKPAINNVYAQCWGKYFSIVNIGNIEAQVLERNFWPLLELPGYSRTRSGFATSFEIFDKYVVEYEKQNGRPLLDIPEAVISHGLEYMSKYGFSLGDWFVTLHVRESNSSNYGRDANIETYLPAIRWIISQGGFVVRIGDVQMQPLPELGNRVIDFAMTDDKNDTLEVFFMSNCRFFVGTTSGPLTVPWTFGTPILWTNAPDISRICYLPRTLLVPKLVSVDGRCMNLSELLNSDAAWSDSTLDSIPDPKGSNFPLVWRNNSPDEILEGVKELVEYCNLGQFPSNQQSISWRNLVLQQTERSTYLPISKFFAEKWQSLIN